MAYLKLWVGFPVNNLRNLGDRIYNLILHNYVIPKPD